MQKVQMKYLIEKFRQWRRKPFKTALCAAYSDGVINSKQLHELAARFDRCSNDEKVSDGL